MSDKKAEIRDTGPKGESAEPKAPKADTMMHNTNQETRGSMDPRAQEEIGKKLRSLYEDVASEPVPDRFLDLLKKLDDTSRKSD